MGIPIAQAIKISLIYIPGDLIEALLASYLVYKLQKSPVLYHVTLKKRKSQ